jgi:hypothetical protein
MKMGPGRFGLPTSPLSGARSNQLSYEPMVESEISNLRSQYSLKLAQNAGCFNFVLSKEQQKKPLLTASGLDYLTNHHDLGSLSQEPSNFHDALQDSRLPFNKAFTTPHPNLRPEFYVSIDNRSTTISKFFSQFLAIRFLLRPLQFRVHPFAAKSSVRPPLTSTLKHQKSHFPIQLKPKNSGLKTPKAPLPFPPRNEPPRTMSYPQVHNLKSEISNPRLSNMPFESQPRNLKSSIPPFPSQPRIVLAFVDPPDVRRAVFRRAHEIPPGVTERSRQVLYKNRTFLLTVTSRPATVWRASCV